MTRTAATDTFDPTSAVERRLTRMKLKPATAIALVGCIILVAADSQSLSLLPLFGTIMVQYHLTAGEVAIVASILGIVGAGAVPVLTRMADRFGMRRFLLAGLLLSTLGNLLCALATDFTLLVIGRSILGLSAAMPIAMALLRERGDKRGTNFGIGLITGATGIGVALAFILSGVIFNMKGNVSAVFWAMTALAAIAVVVAWFLLPDYRIANTHKKIDYIGAILLIIALVGIAVGLSTAFSSGLLVGVVALIVWVIVELKVKNPLIDVRRTFRRTTVPAYFVMGIYAALATIFTLGVVSYVESPYEKLGYGLDASVMGAALFMMPVCVTLFVAGFLFAPIVNRIGPRNTLIIGAAGSLLTTVFLVFFHTEVWQYIVAGAAWGLVYSLGYSGANAAYLHAAPKSNGALFSSAATFVGGAVGSLGAVVYTVVLGATPMPGTAIPSAQSYTDVWITGAVLTAIVLILSLILKPVRFGGEPEDVVVVPNEVTGVAEMQVAEEH